MAFLAEFGALHDAEAVLFVDDGQAEARELEVVFEEGVGADEDICAAVGGVAADVCFLGWGEGAGDEEDSEGPAEPGRVEDAIEGGEFAAEEACEGAVVLFGKDFGWSHQCALVAGGDGSEEGGEGDDGFSGADIALEEAKHGVGAAEVVFDLGEGAFLGSGEGEGKAGEEWLAEVSEGEGWGVVVLLPFGAAEEDGALDGEEFAECEPLAGVFGVVGFCGGVVGADGLGYGCDVFGLA